MTNPSDAEGRGPRIGVLGGTFDPITVAHLLVAESARDYLGLDHVRFLLTPEPPHKPDRPLPDVKLRLELLEAALAERGDGAFVAETIEHERPGPHYTAETLPMLVERGPADATWFFLIGGDSAVGLPRWRDPRTIATTMRIGIVERPGSDRSAIRRALTTEPLPDGRPLADWSQIEADIIPDVPYIGVSSTEVRRRVATGHSIRYLVPESTRRLIAERGLYRS